MEAIPPRNSAGDAPRGPPAPAGATGAVGRGRGRGRGPGPSGGRGGLPGRQGVLSGNNEGQGRGKGRDTPSTQPSAALGTPGIGRGPGPGRGRGPSSGRGPARRLPPGAGMSAGGAGLGTGGAPQARVYREAQVSLPPGDGPGGGREPGLSGAGWAAVQDGRSRPGAGEHAPHPIRLSLPDALARAEQQKALLAVAAADANMLLGATPDGQRMALSMTRHLKTALRDLEYLRIAAERAAAKIPSSRQVAGLGSSSGVGPDLRALEGNLAALRGQYRKALASLERVYPAAGKVQINADVGVELTGIDWGGAEARERVRVLEHAIQSEREQHRRALMALEDRLRRERAGAPARDLSREEREALAKELLETAASEHAAFRRQLQEVHTAVETGSLSARALMEVVEELTVLRHGRIQGLLRSHMDGTRRVAIGAAGGLDGLTEAGILSDLRFSGQRRLNQVMESLEQLRSEVRFGKVPDKAALVRRLDEMRNLEEEHFSGGGIVQGILERARRQSDMEHMGHGAESGTSERRRFGQGLPGPGLRDMTPNVGEEGGDNKDRQGRVNTLSSQVEGESLGLDRWRFLSHEQLVLKVSELEIEIRHLTARAKSLDDEKRAVVDDRNRLLDGHGGMRGLAEEVEMLRAQIDVMNNYDRARGQLAQTIASTQMENKRLQVKVKALQDESASGSKAIREFQTNEQLKLQQKAARAETQAHMLQQQVDQLQEHLRTSSMRSRAEIHRLRAVVSHFDPRAVHPPAGFEHRLEKPDSADRRASGAGLMKTPTTRSRERSPVAPVGSLPPAQLPPVSLGLGDKRIPLEADESQWGALGALRAAVMPPDRTGVVDREETDWSKVKKAALASENTTGDLLSGLMPHDEAELPKGMIKVKRSELLQPDDPHLGGYGRGGGRGKDDQNRARRGLPPKRSDQRGLFSAQHGSDMYDGSPTNVNDALPRLAPGTLGDKERDGLFGVSAGAGLTEDDVVVRAMVVPGLGALREKPGGLDQWKQGAGEVPDNVWGMFARGMQGEVGEQQGGSAHNPHAHDAFNVP